jgi:hypothetical protein
MLMHLGGCKRLSQLVGRSPDMTSVCDTKALFALCRPSLPICDMRTLYSRDVPGEVLARLERLADGDATLVGVVAVRELTEVSRRADNPALFGSLRPV